MAKDNFIKPKSQFKLLKVNKTRHAEEPNTSISSTNPPNNPNININMNTVKFTTNTMPIPKYMHSYNIRSKDTSKLSQINSVLNTIIGKLEEYCHLRLGKEKTLWEKSLSNELGCLA